MERTDALDLHWQGCYYCLKCKFYTGQLEQHEGHIVQAMPRIVVIHPTDFQAYRVVYHGKPIPLNPLKGGE